jgi:hypothetical protein
MATFAQSISNSDELQLIGVVANCSGILSSALGIYSFVESEQQPDNATILDAINKLQQTLDTDFAQLGDLIQQQTQIIVDTVNRDGMALALSSSDVATDRIQAFLSNGDNNALETAETESIAGFQFFNELGLSSFADMLFFLPGLVKAASVRIFVLASEPLKVREPRNVIIDNISSMVILLANMINTIKSTVDAAHTVNEKSHTVHCAVHQPIHGPGGPPAGAPFREVTVIDGYFHEERGQVLAFFDAQQGANQCEQPSGHEAAALAAAQQSRAQGVTDELAFIGIPHFEAILQTWQNLIAIKTRIDLNGKWASGGIPGPVISVNSPFISVDMSAYQRPTASGMIVDSSDITVTFPDDKTYTGKLQPPDEILWSNHSAWTKVEVKQPVVSKSSAALVH